MLVDAHSLIPMPPELSFEAAALLSCCLTTGLASVFNVAKPAPGAKIAIFGCGGVGLGAVQAARDTPAAVRSSRSIWSGIGWSWPWSLARPMLWTPRAGTWSRR